MQKKLEMNTKITLLSSPLEKNQKGLYPIPTMRCGVLPFFIDKDNQIIWGCIASNRVGPITITPPAGIQDILVQKAEHCFKLEVGKPLPDLDCDVLKPFIGKLFRDQQYQDIITCLVENEFSVQVENPVETALHETLEEHGIDLRSEGKDSHLLNVLCKLPLQILSGNQGATAQCTYLAYLKHGEGVDLNYVEKTENKIRRNFGRSFYEKGCWGTLASFKKALKIEQEIFGCVDKPEQDTSRPVDLIKGVLATYQSAIDFLEHLESLIKEDLKKLLSEEILYQDSALEMIPDYRNGHEDLYISQAIMQHGIFSCDTSLQNDHLQKKQEAHFSI